MLNNKVEICGVNTSKLPLLSKKEKEELFVKIKAGDEEARQIFISSKTSGVASITVCFSPLNSIVEPALLAEARNLIDLY